MKATIETSLVLCLTLFSLFAVVGGLKCYVCEEGVPFNHMCNESTSLKDCGYSDDNKRYDVCQTDVEYERGKGLVITKKCAFGPCDLGDDQSAAIGLTNTCDKSKDKWACTTCCDQNNCNKDAASALCACPKLVGMLVFLFCLLRAFKHELH